MIRVSGRVLLDNSYTVRLDVTKQEWNRMDWDKKFGMLKEAVIWNGMYDTSRVSSMDIFDVTELEVAKHE